jgi:hypothetical protein
MLFIWCPHVLKLHALVGIEFWWLEILPSFVREFGEVKRATIFCVYIFGETLVEISQLALVIDFILFYFL